MSCAKSSSLGSFVPAPTMSSFRLGSGNSDVHDLGGVGVHVAVHGQLAEYCFSHHVVMLRFFRILPTA